MLRITRLRESRGEVVLRVEGRCVGPFAGVLADTLGAILVHGKSIRLEVKDLDYVDVASAQVLRAHLERGISLDGCGGLLRLQLGLPPAAP